jgi:hypothetical protein
MQLLNNVWQRCLDACRGMNLSVQGIRSILGWPVIVLGLILLPLPIPLGLILLIIGAWIVGPRSRPIRMAIVVTKRGLRHWARVRVPYIGDAGRFLLRKQREIEREYRRRTRGHTPWQPPEAAVLAQDNIEEDRPK